MDAKGEKVVAREKAEKAESWGMGETYKVRLGGCVGRVRKG